MARLIPIKDIPYSARNAERNARRKFSSRAAALQAASWRLVVAEGCYSGAYPPVLGWCVTEDAAAAISEQETHMPGGTVHNRARHEKIEW